MTRTCGSSTQREAAAIQKHVGKKVIHNSSLDTVQVERFVQRRNKHGRFAQDLQELLLPAETSLPSTLKHCVHYQTSLSSLKKAHHTHDTSRLHSKDFEGARAPALRGCLSCVGVDPQLIFSHASVPILRILPFYLIMECIQLNVCGMTRRAATGPRRTPTGSKTT